MHYVVKLTFELTPRLAKYGMLAALLAALTACGSLPTPQAQPERYAYVTTVEVSPANTRSEIEARYGGEAVVWQPDAGFAILGLNETEAGELSTLSGLEPNQDVLSTPEARAEGWTAWGGGWTAWGGGWTAWGSGWAAWSGGAEVPVLPKENRVAWRQINLPQAQALTKTFGRGVKVAVIDSGIDLNHPMFQGRLAPASEWYDFVDADARPQEAGGVGDAGYGHGTAVAGLVLQVAPKATILPIRVLRSDGSGDVADVVSAIDWAVSRGAKVINLSLGADTNIASLAAMVNYALSKGIYVVASVGNSASASVTYPAAAATASPFLVSVGSVDALGKRSSFSNYGAALELLAPGERIYSAAPGNRIAYWSGTSFAAPLVSGSLATALMDTALINRGKLEAYLAQSAVPSLVSGNGHGLLNASAFLQKLPDFQPRRALLVVGSTTLSAGDSAVRSRLQSMGYSVTLRDDALAAATDASGKDVVLISATVAPSALNGKFRDVAVPVVVWEANLFDDMKLTGAVAQRDYWSLGAQTQINLVNSAHPLAAGFSGAARVYSSTDSVAWGMPGASAVRVATLASDSSRASIFGYGRGAAMVGMSAPARRVGFFLGDTGASRFTGAGAALFDAAVTWAVTGN